MIIEMNAGLHGMLHRLPFRLLKPLLRTSSDVEKATILRIKTLQDGVGDQ